MKARTERGITTGTGTTEESQTGSREKVAQIVARHGARIAHLAAWYLDGQDVDDVLQDIWASVYRNLWQLDDEARLLPWLRAVTFHACVNHRKARAARLRRESPLPPESWSAVESFVSDDGSALDEILETRELQQVVSAAMDRLPGPYGMLLRLRYMKDLSYREIADTTGMSANLVKQRLRQGREILRSRLAKSLNETGIDRRHREARRYKNYGAMSIGKG